MILVNELGSLGTAVAHARPERKGGAFTEASEAAPAEGTVEGPRSSPGVRAKGHASPCAVVQPVELTTKYDAWQS